MPLELVALDQATTDDERLLGFGAYARRVRSGAATDELLNSRHIRKYGRGSGSNA